ncbi:CRISPR system Cascade subunit CasB [Lipingzhangella halophila]|uniref:CRISPR system Cascade subunit CasB n=1 Tax=Lipingzhangella halophila TaxID=1783352 RepID=A0A7W7RJV5_9ACTN|nr:type I-E CRISPR-associated protein Cse2/CasB [Lipingzhangella halophila]MBB4933309.1 CRISPR system Cascade subunit CasB [Lipingzhangella halophila]
MTQPPTNESRTDLETAVGAAVDRRVGSLQGGYIADTSSAVSALAQLRGGAGKLPHDTPELWGLTCDIADYTRPGWSEEDEKQADTAVHIALTLYALHQQSHREHRMHQRPSRNNGRPRNHDVGRAVRALMSGPEIDEPLRQRLVQAGKATSVATLAFRLRGIVQLLRRDAIPLDYGLLADHLFMWQRPGGRGRVRAAWGRGFTAHRPAPSGDPADTDSDAETEADSESAHPTK